MKLTHSQFMVLGNDLVVNQGNCYDVALRMFGEFPDYDEGTMGILLKQHSAVGHCLICDRWFSLEQMNKHPVYTKAGLCWCNDCKAESAKVVS